MAVAVISVGGSNLLATLSSIGAASVETATLGGIRRRRDVSLENDAIHLHIGNRVRDG